jgi:hypothetical protein
MDDNFNQLDDLAVPVDSNLKIYSKKAILGFSFFFSSIFGAVLLMQNLKDIGKKREANTILLLSIIYTAITIFIVNIPDKPNTSLTYICNIIGGITLAEYFYKKNFPDDQKIVKKKIWKPLIISIVITIPLLLAAIYSM